MCNLIPIEKNICSFDQKKICIHAVEGSDCTERSCTTHCQTSSLLPYLTTSRNISIGFQSLLALNIKFCLGLLFLRPKWGWHLNISVTPSDFRPLPHPFVLYAPWTGGSFMSLGLGQPWPCLDLLPLWPLLFGIAFHLQLVLLSYHPIFLRPYHFLKLVSFLGANRTKSASVCLWLLRGAI